MCAYCHIKDRPSRERGPLRAGGGRGARAESLGVLERPAAIHAQHEDSRHLGGGVRRPGPPAEADEIRRPKSTKGGKRKCKRNAIFRVREDELWSGLEGEGEGGWLGSRLPSRRATCGSSRSLRRSRRGNSSLSRENASRAHTQRTY